MQLIKKGQLRILLPEDGYELISKETGIHSEKVYLGNADSPDNYIEVMKEGYVSDENILLINTIDSMLHLLEPVLVSMPMTLDNAGINPFEAIIDFYVDIINRELKTLQEAPGSLIEAISRKLDK